MNQIPQRLQNQPLKRSAAWSKSTKGLAPICRDALTRHWKGRPPRRVWQLMRLIVFERDGWVCVYCLRFVPRKLAIDESARGRGLKGWHPLDNLLVDVGCEGPPSIPNR